MSRFTRSIATLAVVAVAGVVTMLVYYHPAAPAIPMQAPLKTLALRIGTTTIMAEVADTPELRQLGLGNRTSLEEGQGMWFIFETDGLWPFWMKDTLIPLDMIWVNTQNTIVHIAHNIEPNSYPQAFGPEKPARYVLEVPAGFASEHGIAEGDKVEF